MTSRRSPVDSRRKVLWVLAVVACLPALISARPGGLGDVTDVRTWSYPDYTRVVVEFTRSVETKIKHLPANAKAGRPERLYLDIDGIWVGTRFKKGIAFEDGLLKDVRLGQNTLKTTRLVIDLKEHDRHRLLLLSSPSRVVVDVYGPRPDAKALRWGKITGKGKADSRLSLPLRSIQTVVIDPGHGGRDPGALGLDGLREKDVNLKLSMKLGKRLEADGFKVVYTRSDDRTLTLEERTATAEAARGDLFVSVHTNASKRKATRGIEIYFLDKNHERHSLDVVARENGISPSEVDTLQRTMIKLRFSEVSRHSIRLADVVHDSLLPGIHQKYRGVTDLGIKKGPFYVLYMASMPAILLESGFLTNRHDAKLLRSDQYLDTMARYVAEGVNHYRSSGMQFAESGDAL